MAANMMEMLKQMQRDQREYMKNLHDMNKNINKKLNIMEGKISDLEIHLKKTDHEDERQQQVLATIERLEQQVRKNNMILFGNEGAEVSFLNRTSESIKPDFNDEENTSNGIKKSEILVKNVETSQLFKETELNYKENNQNTDIHRQIKEDISDKPAFIARGDIDVTNNTSIEEDAATPDSEKDTIKTATGFSTDFAMLDDKLNTITDMYQSDMQELELLIMDIVTEIKISVEEAVSTVYKQDNEQIHNTYVELKQIAETNNIVMKEIKDIIKNYVAKKIPVEEAARTVLEHENITIFPTYFSADQLSALNAGLKQISETYQGTNIFPIVTVLSDYGQHPIIKQLIQGVYYERINRCSDGLIFRFKFGTSASEQSYISDLIARYANLSFNHFVKLCMLNSGEWEAQSKIYDLTRPMIYNKRGDLVRLDILELY